MFFSEKSLPIYSIFILILIISGNYIGELFPCRIRYAFTNNIIFKHTIAFLTVLFFVTLTDPYQEIKVNELLVTSIKLYGIFILLSNTITPAFYLALILAGITYITNLKKKEYLDEKESLEKQENKDVKKINILEEKVKKIEQINQVCILLFLIITISGSLIYLGEKKHEYKNNFKHKNDFSYFKFFLGTPVCTRTPDKISYLRSIKHILS